MTRHRMRLVGTEGDVGRAWLDATRLSPDYDGIRCAVAIGEEGGVVCVAVEGWSGGNETALRGIATDAVVAVELSVMMDQPDVSLTDDDGAPVEIEPGEDDTAPIDEDVVQATEQQLRLVAKRLPTFWEPVVLMALAIAAIGYVLACTDVGWKTRTFIATMVAIAMGATALLLLVWRHKADPTVFRVTADREMERRRVLDALVAQTTAPH